MVQIIEQSLPYGKLAENFGRSLGESMGGEVQRQVTVRGVSKLANQIAESGISDPLEVVTSLQKIPGMTPELANLYMPMIQSAIQFKNAERRVSQDQIPGQPVAEGQPVAAGIAVPGATAAVAPAIEPAAAPAVAPVAAGSKATTKRMDSLVSPEEQQVLDQKPIVLTQQQLDDEAYRLIADPKNKGRYLTMEEARGGAQKNTIAHNQNLENEQGRISNLQARTEETRNKVAERVESKLQTQGLADTWSILPGTILDTLTREGISLVADGKTPEQAAEIVGKKALSVVREIDNLKNEPKKKFLGRGSKELVEWLSRYKKVYESVDALPEFVEEMKRKGFGDHMASFIAYPASVGARKELSKLQKLAKYSSQPGPGPGATPNEIYQYRLKKNQLQVDGLNILPNIVNELTPTDSIYTIALAINDAGLDENAFYQEVEKMIESGEFVPTDRQKQEIDQQLPVDVTLSDMYSALLPFFQTGKLGFYGSIRKKGEMR